MNEYTSNKIIKKIDKENEIFSNKGALDPLSYTPQKIVGLEKETEQLLRFLLGYKKHDVPPLILTYGSSGTGKTTIVRDTCSKNEDIQTCYVDLREARTLFEVANAILSALGGEALKNYHGTNKIINEIPQAIESLMIGTKKKLFVLILDEYDVIFLDKRANPSDFVYRLVKMVSKLRDKRILSCIVAISNEMATSFDLDNRVKSRIGTSEIFFKPFSEDEIFQILQDRACEAFYTMPNNDALQYCAKLSASENGDARRALELLKKAGELASSKDEPICRKYLDLASQELQEDRVQEALSTLSTHQKYALYALVIMSYLMRYRWSTTHTLFEEYLDILSKEVNPLGYKRFSDILKELENTDLVIRRTGSKGRNGYNSEYMLNAPAKFIIQNTLPEKWRELLEMKHAPFWFD